MKGFLGMALALIVLDVVLEAPASRLSVLLERPSHWLAAWLDPTVPLVAAGHLSDDGSGSSGSASSKKGKDSNVIGTLPIIGKVHNPL